LTWFWKYNEESRLQIGASSDYANMQLSHLSRQTKFTIHKTLIRPVLLYGSETWVLIKREEHQLLVFKRKVLRTKCGPKIENVVCRRRYTTTNSIKSLTAQMP
jgi:hypothetical protein